MSYAMHPLWWAAWIAPAPIIFATQLVPASHRRWLTLLTGSLGGISSFSYHLTIGGWLVAIFILVLVALAWSSAIRLAVALAERGQFLPAVFAVPTVWAAIDTLLIHLSPHGSAGSIAYSQMDALPVIQVASLGGIPAITFIVLLGGSLLGLFLGFSNGAVRHRLLAASTLGGTVVAAALVLGITRLDSSDQAKEANVTLIAMEDISELPQSWTAFWQIYGAQIEQSSRAGAIVVLPEDIVRLPRNEAEAAARNLAALASADDSTIVVGVSVEDPDVLTRRALVALPDGTYRWYLKQHLIPGIESQLTPGSQSLVLPLGNTIVGIAICKDMHFPTLGREYGSTDARLMIVPAYDFDIDDWLTARMTVLRGVESGFSIARSARNGFSFVSDRYGRVIAERRSGTTLGVLEASAPINADSGTIYTSIGDVFGWFCVLGWAALFFLRSGLYRRALERFRSPMR